MRVRGQKSLTLTLFTSLEGKAKWNYQVYDEKGDLTLEKILEKMDMIMERLCPSGTSTLSYAD